MNIEELLNKYQQQNITKANSLVTKTIYDYNNLELIKKDFYEKSFGLKKALSFMDSFLNRLKTKKHIKQSNDYLNQYNDGEVIIYDFRKKVFYIYQNAVVEDVFLEIFLEGYFEIDKNILYIKLYEAMFRAKEKLKLALNLMEIGNIVNWFLSNLRNQVGVKYENKFFFEISIKGIPEVFFKESKEKHQEFMNNFFSLLVEEKIIRKKENDCYEFLDIENSIRLIYGIFDLFWFNRPEKRFIFKTDFELDKEFFKNLMEPGVDYSNDSFCSDVFFAKKTKINNIIFCYTISSMFCYLALHTHIFTNSLYSDFLIDRYEGSF